MEKDILMELDEMRSQFGELKSMLKDQQIVNEKMARRAMKGDYNKVRKDLIFAIVLEVVAIPLQVVLLPLIGMPTWYLVFTVLFLLSALVASVYSLRRYASAEMISGNLTEVALGIVKYKRFELKWFLYAIPLLLVWIFFFFYYLTRGYESELVRGSVWGGIIGVIIGFTFGFINYYQNLKRMNRLLRQIKEVKGDAV